MAPKKKYDSIQMNLAIEAVKAGENVSTAARKFRVPRITLRNKVTGKSPIDCSMGPPSVLAANEEKLLVKWLLELSDRHFPLNKEQLLDSVQQIMLRDKRPNPFTNNRPGKKWFNSFLQRNPELTQRTAQNLTTSRDAVTEQNIQFWFQEVVSYLKDQNLDTILEDPNRVFNADESAFFLQPSAGRVLARRGDKHVYSTSGNDKENLTVLVTANAAGKLPPPMIVFPYERIPAYISASVPETWGIGRSDTGWMCGSTFYEYVTNLFYPWLIDNAIPQPVLFFLDGHGSHLTAHLSEFCSQHGIEIIALYPNSTHILQPMDVAVFRPLKSAWRNVVTEWKTENLGQQLKRENFAQVFQKALNCINPECIKNGFRAGGLHPFGPENIDFTKITSRSRESHPPNLNVSNRDEHKNFLRKLESEVVTIFSAEKLCLFNRLYYANRTHLESELPDEDQSLYIIWAKYKNLAQGTATVEPCAGVENDSTTTIHHESMTDTHATPSNDSQFPHTKSTTTVSIHLTQPENTFSTTSTGAMIASVQIHTTPVKNTSSTDLVATDTTIQPEPPQTTYSTTTEPTMTSVQIHETPANNAPSTDSGPSATSATTAAFEIISSANMAGATITSVIHKTPAKITAPTDAEPSGAIHPIRSDNTPNTKCDVQWLNNAAVPSPFKKVLFWPEPPKKKRRISKERMPSAITSKAWREYNEKKNQMKKKLEEEKEKRKKERQDKKVLKEKNLEEKNRKKIEQMKHKKATKKTDVPSSSSSENSSVEYAESSEWDEKDSEYEDVRPVDNYQIKKGDFAIVCYRTGKRMMSTKKFVSIIEEIDESTNDIKVTSMKAVDTSNELFHVVDNDTSYVSNDQILGLLQEPTIVVRGERIYYKFANKIDLN